MASAAGDGDGGGGGSSSGSPVEGNVAPVASPALTEQMAVMKAAASLAEQSTRAITAAVAAYTAAQARSQHRAAKPSAAPSPPSAPSASASTQHPPHPRALLKQRALPLLGSVIKVGAANAASSSLFAVPNPHPPPSHPHCRPASNATTVLQQSSSSTWAMPRSQNAKQSALWTATSSSYAHSSVHVMQHCVLLSW